ADDALRLNAVQLGDVFHRQDAAGFHRLVHPFVVENDVEGDVIHARVFAPHRFGYVHEPHHATHTFPRHVPVTPPPVARLQLLLASTFFLPPLVAAQHPAYSRRKGTAPAYAGVTVCISMRNSSSGSATSTTWFS